MAKNSNKNCTKNSNKKQEKNYAKTQMLALKYSLRKLAQILHIYVG